MNNTFTMIVKQDGEWWIGWVMEVPGTNCQEASREELLENLKIVLGEALAFDGKEFSGKDISLLTLT